MHKYEGVPRPKPLRISYSCILILLTNFKWLRRETEGAIFILLSEDFLLVLCYLPRWEMKRSLGVFQSLCSEFSLAATKLRHCSAITGMEEATWGSSKLWKQCLWLKCSPAGIKPDRAWRIHRGLVLCSRTPTKPSHDSTKSSRLGICGEIPYMWDKAKCRNTELIPWGFSGWGPTFVNSVPSTCNYRTLCVKMESLGKGGDCWAAIDQAFLLASPSAWHLGMPPGMSVLVGLLVCYPLCWEEYSDLLLGATMSLYHSILRPCGLSGTASSLALRMSVWPRNDLEDYQKVSRAYDKAVEDGFAPPEIFGNVWWHFWLSPGGGVGEC